VTGAFDAILFDADGVLQSTDEKWFYAMTALIGTDDEKQVERFFGDIMAAELPSLAGRLPFEGPLGEALATWRITTPAAEVLQLWHHVDVDRGVVAAVSELRAQGIRCALATNQHPERAAYMRENLGYDEVFDDLFYSCELGVAKPDPAYFTEVVRRLGTVPGRTLLLDDNADNVAEAKEAGLVAELFASDGGRSELDRILEADVLGLAGT
jgi:HAD superfamily hydrolase (TIGR01509 family)